MESFCDRLGLGPYYQRTDLCSSGCWQLQVPYSLSFVLVDLGYTIGIKKSVLVPVTSLGYLGLIVDSVRQSFLVPRRKIESWALIREKILACKKTLWIKTLQRFQGKCISFSLAVPAAKLFIREMSRAIASSLDDGQVSMTDALREEISHWRYLDDWKDTLPWRDEKHVRIAISTDASGYGRRSPQLTSATKRLYFALSSRNVQLNLSYVPSKENVAGFPSRTMPRVDSKLSISAFERVDKEFGGVEGHSFDLMSLDSNVMKNKDGFSLPHFTPFPSPDSNGVNVFSQDLRVFPSMSNPYVCPPFSLIGPLLKFLLSFKIPFTIVVPEFVPHRYWWVELNARCSGKICLGTQEISSGIGVYKFSGKLVSPNSLSSALPSDVIAFLVWKDGKGRTRVHRQDCHTWGGNAGLDCECPKRLAFGTIDSLIGKLRAIFPESGRGAEWQSLLGVGNPASCRSVKNYLSNVREEQLKARVTPRQAEPILVNDLLVISEFIRALLLHSSTLRAIQIFMYARDQALFKALFFAGDRAADLLQVKVSDVLRFSDNSGLLFNHVWTKSL
ncbi:unnamed protein product, partial [Pocillopora meandrina]